jgi:hypothetical protein
LHDDSVPVHSYFTITIEDDKCGSKEKMFIADIDKAGKVIMLPPLKAMSLQLELVLEKYTLSSDDGTHELLS